MTPENVTMEEEKDPKVFVIKSNQNQDQDVKESLPKDEEIPVDIGNTSMTPKEDEERSNRNDIRFYPPVYIQRYVRVRETLKKILEEEDDSSPKLIMEVGAAELSLHVHLKNLHDSIQKLVYMDIDSDLLKDNKSKVKPLAYESLVQRETPLVVQVYSGCVTKTDARILKSDPPLYAIIGIEILEHLDESTELQFIETTFGKYAPPIIILTTPNGDFNKYLGLAPGKFRHWDHRFELTRDEFSKWCHRVVEYYPKYTFYTEGIGEGPEDSRDFGCVSQMAVFSLKQEDQEEESNNNIIKAPDKPFSLNPVYRVDQNRNGNQDLIVGESSLDGGSQSKQKIIVSDNQYPYDLIESIDYPWAVKPPLSHVVKNNVQYYINNYVLKYQHLEECWERNETTERLTFKEIFFAANDFATTPKKQKDELTMDNLKTWLEEDGYKFYGEPEAEGIIINIPSYESYHAHFTSEEEQEVDEPEEYESSLPAKDHDDKDFSSNVEESEEDWD